MDEAQAVIDELAAMPVDPGVVLSDIHLLRMRALLAFARGEDGEARQLVDRYRDFAARTGYVGHELSAKELQHN